MQSLHAQDEQLQIEQKKLFQIDRQRSIPIQIYQPDQIRTQLPLVIINHGYGVAHTEYSFIASPLCQDGYCVISIQHDLPEDPPLPRTGNLFEKRKPLWENGVQNILFTLAELGKMHNNLNLQKVILIGHSNGGDISMLFTSIYPELVEKVISLDSLRMPFPTKDKVPILSLRANDTKADKDVFPDIGATIIDLKNAKHIDMYDAGLKKSKRDHLLHKRVFNKIYKLEVVRCKQGSNLEKAVVLSGKLHLHTQFGRNGYPKECPNGIQ